MNLEYYEKHVVGDLWTFNDTRCVYIPRAIEGESPLHSAYLWLKSMSCRSAVPMEGRALGMTPQMLYLAPEQK